MILVDVYSLSFSILNENKTVYQLYKDLVISGLVPADDFWTKFVDVSVWI